MRVVDEDDDATFRKTASGMEIELFWSKDGTLATMHITKPGDCFAHTCMLTVGQLAELRDFLADKLE